MKTRLEILCEAHKMQGGTIHWFNTVYGTDVLNLSDFQFLAFLAAIRSMDIEQVKAWAKEIKGL